MVLYMIGTFFIVFIGGLLYFIIVGTALTLLAFFIDIVYGWMLFLYITKWKWRRSESRLLSDCVKLSKRGFNYGI